MNILGFSGLTGSIAFKRREFQGLSEREYNIVQGLDAAAALIGPDGIIAAAAEERFTRKKATNAFPEQAIKYCLEAGKLKASEVDFFAHGFDYEPHRAEIESDDYGRRQYEEVFSPKIQKRLLSQHFGVDEKKFVAVQHHLAHAASSFYLSGFQDSLILISDGMGEVQSMTVAVGNGNDITELAQVSAFHSLGMLYGVFTLHLGFFMNSDEYKVMGLAPYGNPKRFFNQIVELVSLRPDGTYTIPFFARQSSLEERETHRGALKYLAEKFGPARDPESEITQLHKDISAALQAVVQTTQMHVLRHFKRQTGQKNLCLAGGVALNCSANGVIRRSELFQNVFVQPAAGDDGTALGAALYAQRSHDPKFKAPKISVPLWGPEFDDETIKKAVANSKGAFEVLEKQSFTELCREVAARISKGDIVGWFQGRMEFGPRALGSRSILADPRDPGMRDKINALVKKREGFRPFAPVVTQERAAEIFEVQPGHEEGYAHMLYVTHVRPEYRDKLPATTHVDGSARVQTVAQGQNPKLWELLKQVEALNEIPVLLNTSFNVRGQPIVCTPEEAIETFLTAKLDLLVMGNTVLVAKKVQQKPKSEGNLGIEELEEIASKHEEFWVNRLSSLEPVSLPHKRKEASSVTNSSCATLKFELPSELSSAHPAPSPEVWTAAFGAFVSRISSVAEFDLAFSYDRLIDEVGPNTHSFASSLPLRYDVDSGENFDFAVKRLRGEIAKLKDHRTYALDVARRHPALQATGQDSVNGQLLLAVRFSNGESDPSVTQLPNGVELLLAISEGSNEAALIYGEDLFDATTVAEIANQFTTFLSGCITERQKPIKSISLLNEAELTRVIRDWNNTHADYPSVLMHEPFEAQAQKNPDAIAVVFEDEQLTYKELNQRANEVAARLRELGIGPDVMVGLCAEVSLDMMAGLLGILKAGGAYLPLDPDFPADRVAFMLEDSKVKVLLTQTGLRETLPPSAARIVYLDDLASKSAGDGNKNVSPPGKSPQPSAQPNKSNLAYVIYTSGSTGKPKGVMITHGNVANFYAAMDQTLGTQPGVWLAVTSISFDISVLELFWTLARGFKVVLQRKERGKPSRTKSPTAKSTKPIDFSLFYFAADEGTGSSQKYRLLLEGAKFADENGFAAVWTPERHFHAFGGLYPNPSITSAAVAAITKNVQIRAGSVVAPLHNPVRIAEEWSVVDNLSNGRVAISFASGWQANDFVLAPENFTRRKEVMLEHIETVRKLWRGEKVALRGPNGNEVLTKILPRPVQSELPIWLTASGNPDTFKTAGELGANVLTHLLGQSLTELQEKVKVYRAAWRKAGHAGEGHVTLMLHTFVHSDAEFAREAVRKPFTAYLRASADLIRNDPWAFGTFKRPASARAEDRDLRTAKLSQEELDAMAAHAFERYFETSGLFGTPEHCLEMADRLQAIGIDEIGCLVDFGMREDQVLSGLHALAEVRRQANEDRSHSKLHEDYTIPAQMARHGVTHMQCTPSLAAMLLEDPRAMDVLGSLKQLLLGGEALPLSLVQKLDIRAEILNMYGPTETTIWSATQRVNREDKAISIGRPIANTELYILDKSLQPVPVGVPGELLIGGAGVVRGYLGRPELTAERFVPNPFKPNTNERLYRTGDLVRYMPDGRVEFLGRLDHQVKLRGFRIELGEIETALREHASVKDGVAIVREDAPGDKRLVAYFVSAIGAEMEPRSLRQFLSAKLPDYMIPTSFVEMDYLPLTPNGKIDRKALPAPNAAEAAPTHHARSLSMTESKIAEVMREVLGIKHIGLHDDFFELGGNSLLATQLIARLREAFHWELPLRLAFEFPTVESLANAISEKFVNQPETAPTKHERISGIDDAKQAPLSFAQQRIWFLHQLEPGPHYNDHFDLRVTGPLDEKILHRALNEIVTRHQTLRSTFSNHDGKPVLAIQPALAVEMPIIDLRGLPIERREADARRLAIEDCQKPFDLEQGPLFRVGLVRITDTDHLLLLTFDHIVVDGWSHGVFLTELTSLYEAFLAGKPSPLAKLPIQYADYAAWQEEWLRGEEIAAQVGYWKKQLEKSPLVLDLNSGRARPSTQSYRGARHFFNLDLTLIEALTEVGRRENCTLYMVFLTAFHALLARYSGKSDIVIGSPVANRNRSETEPLIGSFMNTLPMRNDASGDPSFVEFLRRVRKISLEAYAHQELPFEKLVAELQPVRDLGYGPIFQVMFILQNTPTPTSKAGLVSFRHFDVDAGSSKMDLTLNIEETGNGAEAWIEYATDLFDHEKIIQMADSYVALLKEICVQPQRKLSQFQLGVPVSGADSKPSSAWQHNRATSVEVVTKTQPTAGTIISPANARSKSEVIDTVTQIWCEVLGIKEIGPDENLFDLGGHSLLITQIISRIRKSLGVQVPIHHFFEEPTVAVISQLVEKQLQKSPKQSKEQPIAKALAG